MVSTNKVQNFITKSAEDGQNLSAREHLAQIEKSKVNSASVDVTRKELRFRKEEESAFVRSLNSGVLQQRFHIETRGSTYIMCVLDERRQGSCRNVDEQAGVKILLSYSSLLHNVMNYFSLKCDETFSFDSMFSDDLQFELVSLVNKDLVLGRIFTLAQMLST